MDTPEYRAFAKCLDRLKIAIKQCVDSVATTAFTKTLIDMPTMSEAQNRMYGSDYRSNELLKAILTKIQENESNFYTFTQILEGYPVLNDIASVLKTELLEAKKAPAAAVQQQNFENIPDGQNGIAPVDEPDMGQQKPPKEPVAAPLNGKLVLTHY